MSHSSTTTNLSNISDTTIVAKPKEQQHFFWLLQIDRKRKTEKSQ